MGSFDASSPRGFAVACGLFVAICLGPRAEFVDAQPDSLAAPFLQPEVSPPSLAAQSRRPASPPSRAGQSRRPVAPASRAAWPRRLAAPRSRAAPTLREPGRCSTSTRARRGLHLRSPRDRSDGARFGPGPRSCSETRKTRRSTSWLLTRTTGHGTQRAGYGTGNKRSQESR